MFKLEKNNYDVQRNCLQNLGIVTEDKTCVEEQIKCCKKNILKLKRRFGTTNEKYIQAVNELSNAEVEEKKISKFCDRAFLDSIKSKKPYYTMFTAVINNIDAHNSCLKNYKDIFKLKESTVKNIELYKIIAHRTESKYGVESSDLLYANCNLIDEEIKLDKIIIDYNSALEDVIKTEKVMEMINKHKKAKRSSE